MPKNFVHKYQQCVKYPITPANTRVIEEEDKNLENE